MTSKIVKKKHLTDIKNYYRIPKVRFKKYGKGCMIWINYYGVHFYMIFMVNC